MQVNIIYCNQWAYRPKASRAGDEIYAAYPDADLIGVPSFGGVFDVEVDGVNIFSKDKEGRFPIDGELVKRIKELEFSKESE
jgi:selenoprotein W-related protein